MINVCNIITYSCWNEHVHCCCGGGIFNDRWLYWTFMCGIYNFISIMKGKLPLFHSIGKLYGLIRFRYLINPSNANRCIRKYASNQFWSAVFITHSMVSEQLSQWWLLRRTIHDDVIKWKHFPRNWPFVRGIHRSPVNSPHKGQWRGALMFSLICVWINDWVNNREAGDLRRYRTHYDVIVISMSFELLAWLVQNSKTYVGLKKSQCFIEISKPSFNAA